MKRSGNVGLVVMGAAAFVATFAGGITYMAWQKPTQAAPAQTAADQNCTTRSDGTQSCQPQRRGFAYYFFPSWGSSVRAGSTYEPRSRTQTAAFAGNSGSSTSAGSGNTTRGGFGSTAGSGSYRVSAGG